MTLQDNEPRCLAYDTPAPMRKKLPHWCDLRETCAMALAVRSDTGDLSRRTAYRVCNDDEADSFIEAQS